MRCGRDHAVRAPADVSPACNGSGGAGAPARAAAPITIQATKDLTYSPLGESSAFSASAARRRASVCLVSCPLGVSRLDVSLLSIGPLGGRLGSGRCGDWQPPSSCNPRLSVLSNDFAVLPCSAAENMKESRRFANGLAPWTLQTADVMIIVGNAKGRDYKLY